MWLPWFRTPSARRGFDEECQFVPSHVMMNLDRYYLVGRRSFFEVILVRLMSSFRGAGGLLWVDYYGVRIVDYRK